MQVGGCAVVRKGHLIAVVSTFLTGCAFVVVVGCAGVRSGGSQEEAQGRTEATKEQGRSPEAASEEARCAGTRIFVDEYGGSWVTNDVAGCPNGGLLSGTDKPDKLDGGDGDDEVRGLGGEDWIDERGAGSDVLYGGDGPDALYGANGEDVLYGGDGNDSLDGRDEGHPLKDAQRDELYCGEGRDLYLADELDYVSRSCEVMTRPQGRMG